MAVIYRMCQQASHFNPAQYLYSHFGQQIVQEKSLRRRSRSWLRSTVCTIKLRTSTPRPSTYTHILDSTIVTVATLCGGRWIFILCSVVWSYRCLVHSQASDACRILDNRWKSLDVEAVHGYGLPYVPASVSLVQHL